MANKNESPIFITYFASQLIGRSAVKNTKCQSSTLEERLTFMLMDFIRTELNKLILRSDAISRIGGHIPLDGDGMLDDNNSLWLYAKCIDVRNITSYTIQLPYIINAYKNGTYHSHLLVDYLIIKSIMNELMSHRYVNDKN
uniref:Uncharacterized protein n=1 Tax=Glossina palpalis gambiensis TaxID=67801 RepID=A0A1B0BYT2_9MUSC